MTIAGRNIPTEPDAFLAWENRQKRRWELVNGVARMMSGGTLTHDLISGNLYRRLGNALEGGPCFVHGSNLKVRSPVGMVTYPDAFVRCGAIVDEDATEIDDPVPVAEVLSPSTRGHDLVAKRCACQAIPSLMILLYLEPTLAKVELVVRQADGGWLGRFVEGLEGLITLPGLDVELTMADLYAGTRAGG